MKPVNSFSWHLQRGMVTQANTNREWVFCWQLWAPDLRTGLARQTWNQAVTRRGAQENSIMLPLARAPSTRKRKARRGRVHLWSKQGKEHAWQEWAEVHRCWSRTPAGGLSVAAGLGSCILFCVWCRSCDWNSSIILFIRIQMQPLKW